MHSAQKFKSVRINYFDANHPFYKGYPLIPHLSHNDGKKLDLGFVYNEIDNNQISPNTPSVIGYGISSSQIVVNTIGPVIVVKILKIGCTISCEIYTLKLQKGLSI